MSVSLGTNVRSALTSAQAASALSGAAQLRLATGRRINSALDNPVSFFTASGLTTRAAGLNNLLDGMGQGIKTIQSALQTISSLTKLIETAEAEVRKAKTASTTTIPPLIGGNEFQVNTYTAGTQAVPSSASFKDGSFVLVWDSNPQDGSGTGVYGQIFDNKGNKKNSEFQINTFTNNDQYRPSVAVLNNDNFIVTWASNNQDGSFDGIYAQQFNKDGQKIGVEFRVNSTTNDIQNLPKIESMDNGDYVIIWNSNLQDGSGYGVYGQRYNQSGTPVGGEFRINTFTNNNQRIAHRSHPISATKGGGFIAVWQSEGSQDGSSTGIFAQRFDAFNNPIGPEFRINENTFSTQDRPSVTTLKDGSFVFAFNDANNRDGSDLGVFMRRFDENGNALTGDIVVNSERAGDQNDPYLNSLEDGGYIVAWESNGQDGSGLGVYAQRYDAKGNKIGSEFKINDYTENDQLQLVISARPDGGFVSAWTSSAQDPDGSPGVQAKIYSPLGEARPELAERVNNILDQINQLTSDAIYNGTNLLRGDRLQMESNEKGSSRITVVGYTLDAQGLGLGADLTAGFFSTETEIDAALERLTSAKAMLQQVAFKLGTSLSQTEIQKEFTVTIINTLKEGADNLTLADSNKEAASLLALETRRQLSMQAISIATQSSSAILGLFR